jgi:E3 ubiquitin-protein ligase HUWE1
MRAFEQEDRAKFLQFVTGTSKVPLQGFAHLEGMNGPQRLSIVKDNRQTDRLPAAHTWFVCFTSAPPILHLPHLI